MTGPQTPQGPKWVQAGACPSIVYNGGTGATPFPYYYPFTSPLSKATGMRADHSDSIANSFSTEQ